MAMTTFLNPPLCAKIENGVQCDKQADIACIKCFLVQYCSKECKAAHFATHKELCKHPLMSTDWVPQWTHDKRIPSFANGTEDPTRVHGPNKYLWGNVPAIDILNLAKNEGLENTKNQDFSIMCAASGDFRNVLKTVLGLPDGYTGHCSFVLNDLDFDVVARNAIFLLIAFHMEPEVSVPAIIHLWYSALVPSGLLGKIRDKILPLIEDVCNKIQTKAANTLLGKSWKLEAGQTLRLLLTKEKWMKLKSVLTVPDGLTVERAEKIRKDMTMDPSRIDYKDKSYYIMNGVPSFRTCLNKYRSGDSILLPLGSSREEFDTPNPTIYNAGVNIWPLRDDAEPHCGWGWEDLLAGVQVAKNDMIGAQFFMLRDMLLRLCERVKTMKLAFRLYQLDARELPSKLQQWKEDVGMFDRIEVSNMSDRAYVGPAATLFIYSPLLKPLSTHPHATLLLLFQGAVRETDNKTPQAERHDDIRRAMQRVDRYLTYPVQGQRTLHWRPETYKWVQCSDSLRDLDKQWLKFEREVGFRPMVNQVGLKMRAKNEHRLTVPWPLRTPEGASKKEYDMLIAKYCTGYERYVELVRAA